MKRIFLFLLLFISLASSAQVRISELPEHTTNPNNGWLPITISGQTRKFNAGNFLWNGGSYSNPSWLISLAPNKLLQAGATPGQGLIWNGTSWSPGQITISGGLGFQNITGTPYSNNALREALDSMVRRNNLRWDSILNRPANFTTTYALSNDVRDSILQRVRNSRTITINGITQDLSTNRTWTLNSTNITEGSNLYFTDARAISALTGQNISIFNNNAGYITSSALTPYALLSGATFTGALNGTSASFSSTVTATNGIFSSGRTLINTTTDNGSDALQVNGSISSQNIASTGVVTINNNNVGASPTSRLLLTNTTPSPNSGNRQAAPNIEWNGTVWVNVSNAGLGIVSGSNAADWRIVHNPVPGENSTLVDNQLLIQQRIGTGAWQNIATFSRTGLAAALQQNTLNLGSVGNNGTLNLLRSSDGSQVGIVRGETSGISVTSGAAGIFVVNGNRVNFSGSPNVGAAYYNASGLFVDITSNNVAAPNSRLVVMGNTYIGSNTAAPTNGLGVVGETILTGVRKAVTARTAAYTATATDHTIRCDATSGAFDITLPTAVGITGRIYVVKKTDASANAITVVTTSSQTIDGATNYSLPTQNKFVMLQSDGANWIIISQN